MQKALDDPELKNKLIAMGTDPFYKSRAETQRFVAGELKSFKSIVQAAGAKVD